MSMYKINPPTQTLIQYYDRYIQSLLMVMQEWRDGVRTKRLTLGRTNLIPILLKVNPKSATYRFLDKFSQYDNLRRLLLGTPEDMMDILQEVAGAISKTEWMEGLTKEYFLANQQLIWGNEPDGTALVDHFNEIMSCVFVEEGYAKQLDKWKYVKMRKIEVCPYCGRAKIPTIDDVGDRRYKPEIDHFLPKSKFPFFGMSAANMIPCCSVCNDIAQKGEQSPLSNNLIDFKIMNPNRFDKTRVWFSFKYNGAGVYNKENFEIMLNPKPSLLWDGYGGILKLESFYKKYDQEVADVFCKFSSQSISYDWFLGKLGLNNRKKRCLEKRIQAAMPFPLDGQETSREYYKFYEDIYKWLIEHYR